MKTLDITKFKELGDELEGKIEEVMEPIFNKVPDELPYKIRMTIAQHASLAKIERGLDTTYEEPEDQTFATKFNVMEVRIKK